MKTILIMAMTADGKIGRDASHLADWTCPEDKKFFISETKKSGCLVMGRKTYDTIGRPLPKRLNIILTSTPDKYENIPDTLEFTGKTAHEILDDLEKRGFESAVICGGAKINTLFLQKNLIDEIYLTIEPKIFASGLCLFQDMDADINLELTTVENLANNTVLLKYKVIK